jgi:hypothetical protein
LEEIIRREKRDMGDEEWGRRTGEVRRRLGSASGSTDSREVGFELSS